MQIRVSSETVAYRERLRQAFLTAQANYNERLNKTSQPAKVEKIPEPVDYHKNRFMVYKMAKVMKQPMTRWIAVSSGKLLVFAA
jgi:hypothetical protein